MHPTDTNTSTKLKRGARREDGKVFMNYYQKGGRLCEYWISTEEFAERMVEIKEGKRRRYLKNREQVIAKVRAYYWKNLPEVKRRQRRHYDQNREQIVRDAVERRRRQLKRDPVLRMLCALRSRLGVALDQAKAKKSARFHSLIGTTTAGLREHLEAQFAPGMTWENHGLGRDKWHVDHIRPCSSFDLTDPAQQHACFHYTNLQPLWSSDNLSKGAKIVL